MTGMKVVLEVAASMTRDDQLTLATRIAANIGYRLVPEDSIQGAEDQAAVRARLNRLENAVIELNPGLNWKPR